jgi:hypothetical protein
MNDAHLWRPFRASLPLRHLSALGALWRQCAVMRVMRRRQVIVLAVAGAFAVGFWAYLSPVDVPRGTMRRFEVHSSAEFYSLLLHSSAANCSVGQPFKVKLHSSLQRVPTSGPLSSLSRCTHGVARPHGVGHQIREKI